MDFFLEENLIEDFYNKLRKLIISRKLEKSKKLFIIEAMIDVSIETIFTNSVIESLRNYLTDIRGIKGF